MAKIPRIERLLNLAAFLLQQRAPVPWADIRRQVVGYDDAGEQALARRFERDKADLRAMGVPIEYTPGDEFGLEGYFIPKTDCFLPALDLTFDDAAALALVSRIAEPGMPAELAGPLRSAIRKLLYAVDDAPDVLAAAEEDVLFVASPPSGDAERSAWLAAAVAAVADRKTVRFRYYAISRDAEALRTVDPYGVGSHEGHWYLVGRDRERGAVRSFRLDRFRSAPERVNDDDEPDFEAPERFDLSRHLGRREWALPESGRPQQVRIRLDSTVAWMVRDNPPREGSLRLRRDGGAVLTVRTQRPEALVRWTLRLGSHAEVLSPAWLRERCAEAARRIAALYREPRHD